MRIALKKTHLSHPLVLFGSLLQIQTSYLIWSSGHREIFICKGQSKRDHSVFVQLL